MGKLTKNLAPTQESIRVHLDITGVVQGVGFRPSVARIAAEHGLSGFVCNDTSSVQCELEGAAEEVRAAVAQIQDHPPPLARIDTVQQKSIHRQGSTAFTIIDSRSVGVARTLVPPDIAVCADCLREMRDPQDRRYGHPFITCTNCGPRYTVITDLPYDRPATTMADFPLCATCAEEYHDPLDRRYHAQTIACPQCGPRLHFHLYGTDGPGGTNQSFRTDTSDETGNNHSNCEENDPLGAAAAALHDGHIIAVKGIGGYHLACRADNAAAVAELRRRKNRPAKPFAVMVADVAAARTIAVVDQQAADALVLPSAPIVLLQRRCGGVIDGGVVDAVAPGLADLGVMVAYSPVHHLLFDRLASLASDAAGNTSIPLVMTSANRGGSPIVFRDCDLEWIAGLADAVLTHDRPIGVPCEDSVITLDDRGVELALRRSRGYAPLPVSVPIRSANKVIFATGGDLKTVVCLLAYGNNSDGYAHLSSHLGDMADLRTQVNCERVLEHLAFMTDCHPDVVACDQHPRYATSAWAQRYAAGRPVIAIQHHHAHAASLLAEHQRLDTPMIALTYDGTGYGADGTIWGSELLALNSVEEFTRVGHLRPFALPGGEGALHQPARIALDLLTRAGVMWDSDLPPVASVGAAGLHVLSQQIPRGFGCIPTTSMGRLCDAVASLLGICQQVSYEGQAAVELEHVARTGNPVALDFDVVAGVLDPVPVIQGVVDGLRSGVAVADMAAGFHSAVIRASAIAAQYCATMVGTKVIGLTGGVFVNRILLQGIRQLLSDRGFEVLCHRVVPCNDGGLALGQAVIAARLINIDELGS